MDVTQGKPDRSLDHIAGHNPRGSCINAVGPRPAFLEHRIQ